MPRRTALIALLLAGCTTSTPYTKGPEGLTIRLGSGKVLALRDRPGSSVDMDVAVYEYRRYLPEIRKHVVFVQGYEASSYLLIDDSTAAQTVMGCDPVVAPDHRWLACTVTNLVLSYSAVEIWSVDGDRPTRALKVDEEQFPGEPEWLGPAAVRIGVKDADGRAIAQRTFRWNGTAWAEMR